MWYRESPDSTSTEVQDGLTLESDALGSFLIFQRSNAMFTFKQEPLDILRATSHRCRSSLYPQGRRSVTYNGD